MYLVLIIAIGAAIEQKGCGLWVGYNSGVHAAILYKKMAVSMPKCLAKMSCEKGSSALSHFGQTGYPSAMG
jgi:hypothetical protein